VKTLVEMIKEKSSLEELQAYILSMAELRGFNEQPPRDTLLVMLEEVGELAKAVRKMSGIGVDHTRLAEYGNLKHEMADVFICLLILANKCKVNLFEAFCEKESINCKRVWKKNTQNIEL
jgi:NTP pyrophosphatase (non-canonical NTP hydrolase)